LSYRWLPLLIVEVTIVPIRLRWHVHLLCDSSCDYGRWLLKILVLEKKLIICELVKQLFKTQGRIDWSYGSRDFTVLRASPLKILTISSSSVTGDPTTLSASERARTSCKYSVTDFRSFLKILQLVSQAKNVSVALICVGHVKKFLGFLSGWSRGDSWRNGRINRCRHGLLNQLVLREPELIPKIRQ